ncbi:MAG: GntR family transcriptional regulator [Beijerinckiaceae bacterium]|nr:GntR family transcriptional regulator [Beijerinckiaceae bacterium]
MKQSSEKIGDSPTRLQQDLLGQIIGLIHQDGLRPGARLNENRLAQRLGVSRTPIRAALEHLAGGGYVERQPNRGMELLALPPEPDAAEPAEGGEDDLIVRIAHDRGRDLLPLDISETELMRIYGASRQIVRAALERLADLDIVERKAGYGWRFLDTLQDRSARLESYRFRMLIETAAIVEPGFTLRPDWAEVMRRDHEMALAAALAGQWGPSSSVGFFEMNAAFHEGIGDASGNRYLAAAIRRQNRLRRLSNYDWTHGVARVVVNCREHLEILERLEARDHQVAAALMRRHLDMASRLQPSFESKD